MLDRTVMRVGAGAAMLGALVLLLFNVLHPRADEVSAEEAVRLAAEEGIWAFDHYMLGWGIVLAVFALVVIARSFTSEPSISWGRMAIIFAVVGGAAGVVTIGIDGFALRIAAEEAGAETALAVAYVSEGLFVAFIATFIGLTPILYGAAIATGDDYPVWLGWAVLVAGVIGMVAASLLFFGESGGAFLALFLIASTAVTLWLGITGYLLWQKLAKAAPMSAGQPSSV